MPAGAPPLVGGDQAPPTNIDNGYLGGFIWPECK
jgi:hypothetical protein